MHRYILFALTLLIVVVPASTGHAQEGGDSRQMCPNGEPAWRGAQTVAGVDIQEDPSCRPDNPNLVAASVKGTNNVPMDVRMDSGLASDAVVKKNDRDGDGDPDVIHIRLEIIGMNEGQNSQLAYEIAPGIKPAFWAFAPKTTGMASEGANAAPLMRMPSPSIRVEQGDTVKVTVQNTHYLPHTIHFHGTDHSYLDSQGEGNDGVPLTSEKPILPGESRTYDFSPRTTGTMFYHCHVQPDVHVLMGLQGMFIVEEDRPNNSLQTFNPGAGKVRHPSAATQDQFSGEFDLQYQGVDKELHDIPKQSDDPRVIAKQTNRVYDVTDRDPDYYLLNGASFPYTMRSSQLIVEPDEQYRLRILNGGSEGISLHTHGHKFEVLAYDGVELPPAQRYHRDVLSVTAAQRADVILNTSDDGLNSYGPGVWLAHDHREEGVTNNGMSPGGNITMITYEQFLGDDGFPQTQGMELSKFFDVGYYEREVPVWESYAQAEFFGEPVAEQPWRAAGTALAVLVAGLIVGWGGGRFLRRGGRTTGLVLLAGVLGLSAFALGVPEAQAQEMQDMQQETATSSDMDMSDGEGGMDMSGNGMGGGMMMRMQSTEHGVIMNQNTDTLPPGCEEIAAERTISVAAGKDIAKTFPGTIFTYDKHNFSVEPCTKLTVEFSNRDAVRHQFMVHDLPRSVYPMGMFSIEIDGPATSTGTFITPADSKTLLVHCGVPQHQEKGMKGQIKNGDSDEDLSNIPGLTRREPGEDPDRWWFVGSAGILGVLGGAGVSLYSRRRRTGSQG